MGRASRRKKNNRSDDDQVSRSVVEKLLRDAGPLIADQERKGPLTIEALQAVLDEAAERYNMELYSVEGAQRTRCIRLLADLCSSFGDRAGFSHFYDQIDPDSADGLTPAALMSIAASNLDRWLGPDGREVPDHVWESFDKLWSTNVDEKDRPAGDAVIAHAREGSLVPNLSPLHHTAGGGEDLLLTILAVIGLLSAVWSASTNEYHDELLLRVMR